MKALMGEKTKSEPYPQLYSGLCHKNAPKIVPHLGASLLPMSSFW
jgi:hypothetical protein